MHYVEFLVYRVHSFIASFLSKEEFASYFSMLTLDDLFYIIPVGLSMPMMAMIGRSVGEGNKKKVKS